MPDPLELPPTLPPSWPRSNPYLDVLRVPPFRRFAFGSVLSNLGDGVSVIAIPWLAIQLTGKQNQGIAVSLALAAAFLPAIPVGLALSAVRSHFDARLLVAADACLRGAALGATGILALSHHLTLAVYIGMLAASSLFHVVGSAGRGSVVVALLPDEQRMAGNSLLSGSLQLAMYFVGPALGGAITAAFGADVALLFDATSFVVLAAVTLSVRIPPRANPVTAGPRGAYRMLIAEPTILWLIAVSFLFNLLYGPVEVALPVHVHSDLHESSVFLGQMWAALGGAAVIGTAIAGSIIRRPREAHLVLIVLGWGIAMLALANAQSEWQALAAFAFGGLVWAPYGSQANTLLQARTPAADYPAVAALWASLTLAAPSVGVIASGPLVSSVGATAALAISGWTTMVLGVIAAPALLAARRARQERQAASGCR